MLNLWQDQTLGGGVGSELVSDHASGRNALLSKQPRQQALSGLCVAAGLGDFVENIAVLIDRAPQPTFLAIDRNDDLVQMPDVAAGGRLTLQSVGVSDTEFHRPSPDGLIRDDDPAFEKHFFNQTQAQWKPEIQPHGMGDDLRWETMAFVADGRQGHTPSLHQRALSPG